MSQTGHGNFADAISPGARFGKLTVIRRIPKEVNEKGKTIYRVLCKCDCGKECSPCIGSVTYGLTKSCGCVLRKKSAERSRQRAIDNGGIPEPGSRFGRLSVIRREEIDGLLTAYVVCKCDCGSEVKSPIKSMKMGHSMSCGCWQSESTSKRNKEISKFKGFKKEFPLTYKTWYGIQKRCYNKKTPGYDYYGGRGVFICDGLRADPRNLVKLIGHRKSKEMTIDRFPIHNGHYTCGECSECYHLNKKKNIRWATQKQQQRNKGDFNVKWTVFEKTRCKSEWIELSGLPNSTVGNRIKRGWSIEDALTTPNKLGHGYDPITDKDRKQP